MQKRKEAEQKRILADLRIKEEQENQKLQEQQRLLEEQQRKLEEQEKRLNDQRAAEALVRQAEEEQSAAVAELKAQEDSYKRTIEDLTQKSETGDSIFAKNKAKQELAQLKQENPLPLRRAKITQEAALRKVEKQRKEAEIATSQVEAVHREVQSATRDAELATRNAEEATRAVERARLESENIAKVAEEATRAAELATIAAEEATNQLQIATKEAEDATKRVEAAVRNTEMQMQEALDFLESAKKKGGIAYGAIWWMEREIKEAKKYLPKSKQ